MEAEKKEHPLTKANRERREAKEAAEKAAAENARFTTTTEEPEILTEKPEPSIPLSQVGDLVAQKVAEAMAQFQPQQAVAPTPQPQFIHKEEYNIDKEIPEFDNWEIKTREYRLKDGYKPITYSLQRAHNGHNALQYFNKKTGKTHTMRYASNQPSFFIENQSTNPADILDAEILFNFGRLLLTEEHTNLQKFLHIHPQFGLKFEEYDHNELSRKYIATKKEINKANALVDTVGDITNRSIASLINPSYIDAWTIEQVEEAVFQYIETSPQEYIKMTQDPAIKLKGISKSAMAKGLLSYSNYRWLNADKNVLTEVSKNQDEYDAIANYLGSGEGRSFYDYLVMQIG